MALRRSSSFTGTEVHPDSRSWPTVAGAGCEAESRSWRPTYRRPPRCCTGTAICPASEGTATDRYPRCSMVELGGTWRAAVADDDLRRTWQDDAFDDSGWEAVEVPGHWRSTPAFADTDGPLLYRRSFEADGPGRGPPRLADLRRALLPRRRVARRRLPRRHRGLLRAAHLRGHRRPPRPAASTTSPSRSPARGRTTSPPSATSPASSSTGTASTPTGTRAASGDRCASPRPARCASPGCGRCAARPPRSGPCSCSAPRSTATPPAPCRVHTHARRARPRQPTTRSPPAPTTSSGRSRSTGPTLWWPRALGDADAPRPPRAGRARRRRGRRRRPTRGTCAPGCARCACDRGSPASTASASSSRARTTGPTRMALAEATPDGAGARRRRWRATPGSTCSGSTPTSPGPSSTTAADEAGLLLWQDLPLQWGYARGIRKQAVRQADRRRRPPRPPPVDRALVRPQRADGDRERPRRCGATRRRSAGWPCKAAAAQELPDLEQDRARPLGEAGPREGRRHPAGDRPLRRAPPPAAARRHRQPPLLRLVPRPRARLPRLPPRRARAWPASSPSSAPRRCPTSADFCEPERWPDLDWERLGRTHALQRAAVRPARAAGRPRHLRRVARRHAGVPGRGGAPAHRGAAPHQVPPDRRVRPVLLRRRPPGGDVVGARPRPGARRPAYDALREAVPAGDRRRRPPARAGHAGQALALDVHVVSDLRAPGRRRRGDRPPALDRRRAARGAGAATSPPTAASASARCRSSCPTRPGRSRSSSTAGTTATRPTTATRRRSSG